MALHRRPPVEQEQDASLYVPSPRSSRLLTRPHSAIPNLFAIETLSSSKAASLLSKALSSLPPRPTFSRLNVFLQLNTSREASKSGLAPLSTPPTTEDELVQLALHILVECPNLRLRGLMTIGSVESSSSEETNPDFEELVRNRDGLLEVLERVAEEKRVKEGVEEMRREGVELSMGMSGDFAQAIRQGSTNVRVGSSIFGARPPRT